MAGGTITTIVGPDDLPALMVIMNSLHLNPTEQADGAVGAPLLEVLDGDEGGDGLGVDKLRKGLEDIFNLL